MKNMKCSIILIVSIVMMTVTGCSNDEYFESPTMNQSSVGYLDFVAATENL